MNTCVHELKDGSCEVWGTCPETIDCEDYVTYKDKKRAKRRHNDVKKAIRKRKITQEVYGEKIIMIIFISILKTKFIVLSTLFGKNFSEKEWLLLWINWFHKIVSFK